MKGIFVVVFFQVSMAMSNFITKSMFYLVKKKETFGSSVK